MPKVGKKHFAYNKKGYTAAKKMAQRTGQKIQYKRGGVATRKK